MEKERGSLEEGAEPGLMELKREGAPGTRIRKRQEAPGILWEHGLADTLDLASRTGKLLFHHLKPYGIWCFVMAAMGSLAA